MELKDLLKSAYFWFIVIILVLLFIIIFLLFLNYKRNDSENQDFDFESGENVRDVESAECVRNNSEIESEICEETSKDELSIAIETIIVTETVSENVFDDIVKIIDEYEMFSNISTIPSDILDAKVKNPFKENRPERVGKWFIENFFGINFETNARPKFLNGLEYDLYNKDLKLAIELNGITHYEHPNWSSQTRKQFDKQRENDERKLELSDKYGVYLITIPIHKMKYPYADIPKWIEYFLPDKYKEWYINDRK